MAKYTFCLAAWKEKFLEEAIRSILSQTYKDLRLIVSDDCSPEDIYGIVSRFNDTRVRYVRNDKNIGGYNLVDHWNLQLRRDAVDSDYVIMASDDDIYERDFLESVDYLARKYPNVDLIRARCRNTDEKGEILSIDDPTDELQTELEFAANLYNGRHINSFANFVFKVGKLNTIRGFVKFPYAWYSDTVTTLLMSKNGVANTTQPMFNYRGSELAISGTTCNRVVSRGKMESALMNYQWMNEYIRGIQYDRNKLNENYFKELVHTFRHDSFATILSYFWAQSFTEKIRICNQLRQGPYYSFASFGKELFMFYMAKYAL